MNFSRRSLLTGVAATALCAPAHANKLAMFGGRSAVVPPSSPLYQPLLMSHYEFANTAAPGDVLFTVGPCQSTTTLTCDNAKIALSQTSDPRIWQGKLAPGQTISANGTITFTETDGTTPHVSDTWAYTAYTPATNATVSATLAGTDTHYLREIQSWLNGIPEENDITVVATLPAGMQLRIWPWQNTNTQLSSGTYTLCKLQLLPEDAYTSVAILYTNGAAAGTNVGSITFTAKNGRNDSGTSSTCTLNITVDNTVSLAWTHGGLNRAGFGGYDLTVFGSATDWTITTQSQPGLFAFFNDAVNAPTWQRIAFAGTYGGTPTVAYSGTSATVTVHSATLGVTQTLTATIKPVAWTICPRPGLDAAGNEQLLTLMNTQWYFGQEIILDPGNYYSQTYTMSSLAVASHPTTPSIVAPTAPYTLRNGWDPNGVLSHDPGWVTMYPRKPDSITLTNTANLLQSNRTNCYFRMSGWPNAIYLSTSGMTWVMSDHAAPNAQGGYGINWNKKPVNTFLHDIYMYIAPATSPSSAGGLVNIAGVDSQMFRIWQDGTQNADCTNFILWNQVAGRKRAFAGWLYSTNKKSFGYAHIDGWQPNATGDAYHDTAVIPAGSTVDFADVFGLCFNLGSPSFDTRTPPKAYEGSQGQYASAGGGFLRSDVQHRYRMVGCSYYDIAPWAWNLIPNTTAGSIITQNANDVDWGIFNSYVTGTGYAIGGPYQGSAWLSYFTGNFDSGAANGSITVARNYSTANAGLLPTAALSGQCDYQNNFHTQEAALTSAAVTWAQAQFQNATIGDGNQTPALMAAALELKLTSVLWGTDGKPMGPFAPKANRLVDFVRCKVYPEALVS